MRKSIFYFRLLLLAFCAAPFLGVAATKYWIGSAGGSFATNANWSTTAGSACGVNANTTAPGASDVATFVSDCTNNAVTGFVNNVGGINIAAGYTGTITQTSIVKVGASGYIQAGGTFTGSSAPIGFNGAFSLSGGIFTSTSGTLTAIGNWSVTGGTFNHNSGTVQFFNSAFQSLTVTGSHTLNNLMLGSATTYGNTLTIAGETTLTVSGTLTFPEATDAQYPSTLSDGTLAAQGDIVQGPIGVIGTTAVTFSGTGAQTWTSSGGTISGTAVTVNKASGTVTLGSNVALNTAAQSLVITSGTLDQGASYSLSTNAVTVGASGAWTNTGSGAVTLGNKVLNSGSITFSGGGAGCGADVILIRSSSAGTPRSWVGSGTFRMEDVDVQDQSGIAAITAYSSTQGTGVGANWTFNANCSGGGGTVGGFNAYETSTAAGAITGVIKTKIAGAAQGIDIIALNAGKTAIESSFQGDVKVEILNASDNSAALDANNCRSSWTVIQTLANPSFVLANAGRETISFTEANAYPNVRVRISYPTSSPTAIGCSNDNFAIRPNAYAMETPSDADWQTAGTTRPLGNTAATGGEVHKAGSAFTIRAWAVNAASVQTTNYNGVPTSTPLGSLVQPAACGGCSLGTFSGGIWSNASGVVTTNTATYSEAGSFTMSLTDTTYADVDAGDSSTAERYISSAAFNVGRFVPDHFDLATANSPQFMTFNDASCGTRSFTYLGQRFSYVTAPLATITAKNAAGATVANYRSALWKVVAGSITQTYSYTTSTGATPGLDTSSINAVALTPGDGVGAIEANAADALIFIRSATTPVPNFTANITLIMTAVDSSEAGYAGNGTIATTTPATFSNIGFDAGNAFRYGRLRLENAYGSELLALPMPMEAQYWNGTAFMTNTADACTAISASNLGLGNYQRNLNAGETTPTLSGRFVAGRPTFKFSKPGKGNYGSVDVTVYLNDEQKTYLRGKWSGANYDQDPTARATFGIYKSANGVIYMREMY